MSYEDKCTPSVRQAPSTEKDDLDLDVLFHSADFPCYQARRCFNLFAQHRSSIKMLLVIYEQARVTGHATFGIPVALRSICVPDCFEVSLSFTWSIGIALFTNTYTSTNGYGR